MAELEIVSFDPLTDDVLLRQTVEVAAGVARDAWGELASPWTVDEVRGRQQEVRASRVEHLAARLDGQVVGMASIDFPLRDNLHLTQAELAVATAHRRAGVGSALLAAVERRTREDRRSVVAVEADYRTGHLRTDAPFAARHGYAAALVSLRSDLELPDGSLDDLLRDVEADTARYAAGYRAVTWEGAVPDRWVDQLARLNARMTIDAPLGDLALEPEVWDADRVRDVERITQAQGRRTIGVLVVHEDTEEAAGFSVLSLPAHDLALAFQWDTLVLREHRGRRLGQLLKTANLRALRASAPAVRRVVTWNAESNEPMLRVNRALGFRVVGVDTEWQKQLDT
ncbi:MAG: GNAT family N-acetyltransferase [Angustibacter sp.]